MDRATDPELIFKDFFIILIENSVFQTRGSGHFLQPGLSAAVEPLIINPFLAKPIFSGLFHIGIENFGLAYFFLYLFGLLLFINPLEVLMSFLDLNP